MRLDLSKIPFGRRLSRHLIYEETDNLGAGWAKGLYLALAADSGGSFIGGPVLGPKGFLRVTPISDGKPLAYSYTASPFLVEMKTQNGIVRFALDGAKTLRIEGSGAGLRLDGKVGFGANAVTTARGVEITQSGSIYLIKAHKGSVALDCRWNLKALRCTDPIVTIEPDGDGAFEIAIFDINDTYEIPEIAVSLEGAAAASEADYRAFAAGLREHGTGFDDFFDLAAYVLWMSFLPFKGQELAPLSKMSDTKIYALEAPVLTLPMTGASRALDIIGGVLGYASPKGMVPAWLSERQNLYEAAPPVYALALSRLIDEVGLESVPKEKLTGFFEAMSKAVGWWLTERAGDDRLVHYAYRHECGWPKEIIFGAGMPSVSPDLAAYLVLAAESLSKIAATLGKDEAATYWEQVYRDQLNILTTKLWDGAGFRCVNAQTGQTAPAEGMLSVIPLILGKRLPEKMISTLSAKAASLSDDILPIIPAALIILGLKASGRDEDAKIAAAALLRSCVDGGDGDAGGKGVASGTFYTPSACAALLALGGSVLQ